MAARGVGTVLTGLAPALAVVVPAQLLVGSGNAGEDISKAEQVATTVRPVRQIRGRSTS
ncbi:hypothetical protein [Streptomyces murinus]|uniref:hypothetical protein n=1 Tax=Streptomyces murinus TaxID=33900 RepID=UPI0021148BD7|nr:hypothetical protein [Streptomyces murinus]